MWAKLEEVFNEIGLDYSRQGSYTDDEEYPGSFFTFWNFDTPDAGFYSNTSKRRVWFWQVYYYTSDPSTLYSAVDHFVAVAKTKGFIVEGVGHDIPSDRPDFIGRMITIKYMEEH